jgi:hypothetical protein
MVVVFCQEEEQKDVRDLQYLTKSTRSKLLLRVFVSYSLLLLIF